MSKPWFRMYHEFAGDPVIQALAFEDQRHFVMLLCLKCSGLLDRDFPSPDFRSRMIVRGLGLDPVTGAEAKRRLMEVGLVGKDWQPTNWAKRQFESDTSTARVQKYRASKSEEKEEISDTDTDTERNVTCNVSETFHETLPQDTWAEWIEHRKARRWSCSKAALSRQLKLLEKFDTATQREIIDNSIQAGWQGLFPPKGNGKGRPTRYEELMQRVNPPSGPNPLLIEGKL